VIKILSISDEVDPRVYSNNLKERHGDVEFVISCGDLSYMYLEYIITILNCPLYFVHGNHDPEQELNLGEPRAHPLGALNLHRRILRNHGILMAGVEGSLDIFVTHAPSTGVHEGSDWTHQGIKAFRWLVDTFQPAYHFHGHIHYYRPDEVKESWVGKTKVINTYRSRVTEINLKDLTT